METRDLVHTHAEVVTQMTATLRTALDFPAVALDVADYNQKMHVQIPLRKCACLLRSLTCLRAWARFRWYMEGGYKSSAGGNGHRNYTSWQEAVTGSGGLPGGASGGSWADGGAWGSTAAALAALQEWVEAPPKVLPCRPFGWKPS